LTAGGVPQGTGEKGLARAGGAANEHAQVPHTIFQMHPDEYRSPSQLPVGGVLIVGSGSSGCQIAEELRHDGRDVYLCVGRCIWTRRRYYGKDLMWWWYRLGVFDETVDTLPPSADRLACQGVWTGRDGGRDLNAYGLARDGVVLLGRLKGISGTTVALAPDLRESLAVGDEYAMRLERDVTEWARKTHMVGSLGPSPADPILQLRYDSCHPKAGGGEESVTSCDSLAKVIEPGMPV
jgi:putative flavoprotein involved in K+ transport